MKLGLVTDAFSLCIVPPSPPVLPEAIDKTKDTVSLKWQLPRHDGKGKIFGYLVEYQKVGAVEWSQGNETPEECPECNYVLKGLEDGAEYNIRVFTVNAAGRSEPAPCKQTVKVHDRLGK
jgi:titin